MTWRQDAPPTAKQASGVVEALSAVHACLHVATEEEDAKIDEWDELLETAYQVLTEDRDQREVVRALLSAAVSLVANYEDITGIYHGALISGLQDAAINYQTGLN